MKSTDISNFKINQVFLENTHRSMLVWYSFTLFWEEFIDWAATIREDWFLMDWYPVYLDHEREIFRRHLMNWLEYKLQTDRALFVYAQKNLKNHIENFYKIMKK